MLGVLLGLPLLGAGAWLLPDWSIIGALRPGIAALDHDGDGALSAAEAAEGSPMMVPFHKLDADADGVLDEPEVLRHLLAEDPAIFLGDKQQHAPRPDEHFEYFPDPRPIRVLRVLFEFMAVQVHATAPDLLLPRYDDMVAAARTGSLESPEGAEVAANLVWAYQQAGLTMPACLTGIAPVPTALHDPAESRKPGYEPSQPSRAPRQGGPRLGRGAGTGRRPHGDGPRPQPPRPPQQP